METITISAKCNNGKLIPLKPLPKGTDYDALIILMRPEKKTKQSRVLGIKNKPLSSNKIKSKNSKKPIMKTFKLKGQFDNINIREKAYE
ncbi:MAG: hypothetical protein FVQ77_04915 [Cytophagales bacterium]|nr:hypothetical protein [Cytophagales bacterium]